MSMINNVAAVDFAATSSTLNAPKLSEGSSEKISAFNQLLYAGTPQGDVGTLSPPQMLMQQATVLGTTVGVDLGAKIAGSVSQSVNKLANMT
ncbi:MAG: type III secretion system inner rod subunit SctI [Enterobacterales bacterium]|uniref:Type III secretion system apparatus protein n=1 Tax=Obesumbacterium proteus ATCC 12841 TaxID=1354268 RepID=A0AA91EGS4_9GAMM|nr:type III secretion system inner rod subunit SctI [Obesumbacterium proteus]MDN5969737.1 type III secretion system inner rod subunit SctI [Enterobacterales bacterium]AMO79803.1 EscI/YscI/HrpB family type III secretion system inner rod protein [Obesumbacterium proteus]MCE9884179.1 type III secretion system inner rod subunit SctI [Obesumbacterium proteus]MCE9916697.1 type III secretion system inner rod subunit SctI [Obesumbacterium proteus]MCE9930679.1 type III secretion system inner rod subuni